jgi:hypothetical protein
VTGKGSKIIYSGLFCLAVLCIQTTEARLQPVQNVPLVDGRFQRQLDALQWRYRTTYAYTRNRYSVSFSDRRETNLFLFNGLPSNIQEEQRQEMVAAVPLAENWRLLTQAYRFKFSAGDVEQWWATAGMERVFARGGAAQLQGGVISDQRNGVRDQGAYLRGAYRGDTFRLDAVTFQPEIRLETGSLNPRTYASLRAASPLRFESGPLQVEGRLMQTFDVRESYQAINFINRNVRDAVESIRTDTTSAYAYTTILGGKNWAGTLETDLRAVRRAYTYRKLNPADNRLFFDSGFLSRRFESRLTLRRQAATWFSEAGGSFGISGDQAELKNTADLPPEQVRRRSEILENSVFTQSRLVLFTAFGQQHDYRRRWIVRAQAGILRHDTPEANPDDRDEQQLLVTADLSRQLQDGLMVGSSLSGERIRNVYLFARRSAENNDRYSLRLLPAVTWTPTDWLTLQQQLVLRANYTVYQFPDATPGISDQSAREYGHKTDVGFRMNRSFGLNLSVQRNELRIGRLFWKTFRETPLDTLITWDVSGTVSRYFKKGWITGGFRFFSKWDFLPLAVSEIEDDDGKKITVRAPGRLITRQFGPTIDIRFPFETKNELLVRGWYQIQNIRQLLYTKYPEAYQEQFKKAERPFSRRIFPNVEMTARLRF